MGILRRALLVVAVLGSVALADTKPTYTVKQVITIPDGKTDRRGEVVAVKKLANGRYHYQVKMQDNGEMLTVADAEPEPTPPPAPVVAPPTTPTSAAPKASSLPGAQTVRDTAGITVRPWENSGLSLYTPGTPTTAPTPAEMLGKPASSGFALKMPSFLRPTPKPTALAQRPPLTPSPAIAKAPPLPPILEPLPTVPEPPASLPATVAAPITSEARVARLADTLRESLLPSSREIAALELFEEANVSPLARTLLLQAATNDPAGTVRACCLRCVAKMGVRDAAYQEVLQAAKSDPHPRVQEELDYALNHHRPTRVIPASE